MEKNDKKGVMVILAITVAVMIFLYATVDKGYNKLRYPRYGYIKEIIKA